MALALVQPNNAGAKNVGLGNGQQFITGGCTSGADCGSKCCANNSQGLGVCSAEAAALQNDKLGCGFNDPQAAVSRCYPPQYCIAGSLTTLQKTIAAAKEQVKKQGF